MVTGKGGEPDHVCRQHSTPAPAPLLLCLPPTFFLPSPSHSEPSTHCCGCLFPTQTRTPSPSPRLTLINSDSTFRPRREYRFHKGGEQPGAQRRDLRGNHLVVTIMTPTGELRLKSSHLQIFWAKTGNKGGWEAHMDGKSLSSSGTSVSKEILVHHELTSQLPKWAHNTAVVKEPWLQPWDCRCMVQDGGRGGGVCTLWPRGLESSRWAQTACRHRACGSSDGTGALA